MPKIKIDAVLCVHCNACTGACKSNALYIDNATWETRFDEGKCTSCGSCAETCPRRAIRE